MGGVEEIMMNRKKWGEKKYDMRCPFFQMGRFGLPPGLEASRTTSYHHNSECVLDGIISTLQKHYSIHRDTKIIRAGGGGDA